MDSREYWDWFGSGSTEEDIREAVKAHGKPLRVFLQEDGFMAALVYEGKVVCVGYDGNEYRHTFIMNEVGIVP